MPARRVLILGGTSEARHLAARLIDAGHDVTTSLAGVTDEPRLPMGKVRRGGFGGAAGLAAYLGDERIEATIDATHPFAAQISRHAAMAAEAASVALARFERPAWKPGEGDRWIDVLDSDAAAAALPEGARVLLTIGRKGIAPFLARRDVSGIIRAIEPPAADIARGWSVMLARPPFGVAAETQLMERERITHLVSKNAGGEPMRAKLAAARALGLPVVMIARPGKPEARCFATAAEIEAWLASI